MKLILLSVAGLLLTTCSSIEENHLWEQIAPADVVRVAGGAFLGTPSSNLFDTPIIIEDFYIGRNLVTQAEWIEVMGENPAYFTLDLNNPVERVTWYEAILFLNRRSELAGLVPFYQIDKTIVYPNNLSSTDEYRWSISINENATGYRLPTNLEWEFAAGGGVYSQGYAFSGSDELSEAGWFFRNSGDEFLDGIWNWPAISENNARTHPVAQKIPNELGLYDMSGNVREWIFNWYNPEKLTPDNGEWRVVRGGSWLTGEDAQRIYFYDGMPPYKRTYELGLRIARSILN
ncbi:MAG: formylglycine-generating enzyme family protein [Turicibacter sp.]|nr:formylglycine-generating enzyme family protein [Turicibacter sp.]